MPKLRRLSGDEVIAVLAKFGFRIYTQRGSHVKLQRLTGTAESQTLTIPRHRELDRGTLRAILRQAGRYIPEEQLTPHFLTE